MIELNLLPDVKLEYVKTQRLQRLVASIAVLVSGLSILLLVILLSIDGLQKKHLSDLTNNINKASNQLKSEPQINKILTVQNQLTSINSLHAGEPAVSRLFTYLNEVTPVTVDINDLSIDFTQYTATITGTSDSLSSVNQYVDTLKLTDYAVGTNPSPQNTPPAFNDVVLSSFGVNSDASDPTQAATYTITLNYAKPIFDISQTVGLVVPTTTTTRLNLSQSPDLFSNAPSSSSNSKSSGSTQ